ncbi:unnamed protein product [Bemisia tabaci]|uniref:Uncharacterized protein n=1 Tax=Bemisia tabaci TaxID=7038 RepID=A0A9P0A851_BEMTA|nr:unnamed protein product [Bemisia tabaci]
MAQNQDPVVNLMDWANDIRDFADQQPLWGEFVIIEPLLREFVLGNVNLAPFADGFDDSGLVNGARVLCNGRQGNIPVDDQMLLLATIGESLFPRLRNRRLDQEPARQLLRMSVSQIVDFPDPDVANAILNKANELYPEQPNAAAREAAIRQGSVENAMLILVAGMNEHRRKFPTFGTELLLHTILAILKTGECSVDFLTKVVDGCKMFGFNVNLDRDLIKAIYLTFGEYINSRDVRAMIEYWKTLVPNKCLRIKLTIEQAEWHNLTSFTSIKTALTLHKQFYWANLFQLHAYSAQLGKFRIAMDIIQDDPYYGFNNNLGEASSTRYCLLAQLETAS